MFKTNLLLLAILLPSISHLYAQQNPPLIEWKKCFGGTKDDKAKSIIRSYDNGFLIAGSTKSNDGDLSAHYGSTDSTDAWLVKLDAQGNIAWQKNYGGTGNDEFVQVIHTSDQEYVALGYTQSVNTGDVSGFHSVSGNYQDPDMWLVKINRQGSIVWQRCLGGSGMEKAGAVRQTPDGGFVVAGSTAGIKDGDIPVADTGGVWVIKLSSQGSIEWSERYGGTGTDQGNDIRPVPGGGYMVVGEARSYDGDFPVAGFDPNSFKLKIAADGTILSKENPGQRASMTNVIPEGDGTSFIYISNRQNCYPMNADTRAISVNNDSGRVSYEACDMNENLAYYIRGIDVLNQLPDGNKVLATGTMDTRNLLLKGGEDGFLANFKLLYNYTTADSANYSWKKAYGGSLTDAFTGIVSLDDNTYLCVGYSNSNDGDVTGNHGGYDYWVIKFAGTNFIKGTVFFDNNSNGVKDMNEPFASQVMVQAKKDIVTYSTRPFQGVYGFAADTGSYTITIPNPPLYHTVVPTAQTAGFTSYGLTDSLPAFALQPIPGNRNYQVHVAGYTAVRPGFDMQYWFSYANTGTDTLVNKPVKLIKDSRLQFISATPAQTNVSGDTITWNIVQLLPGASGLIQVLMKAAAPPALANGDTVYLTTIIDTTGDVDKNNNTAIVRAVVTGSFDPNDKQETHGATLYKNEYDAGNGLTYTIRFQNTGTDTAFNIVIRDTLSDKLAGASLEVIAASHPYKMLVKDNKYCSWTFENILLVDSNRNEPASHGYVTYRIKPVAGLNIGDKILNRAAIYFDFNLPVITNTQETVIRTTPVPPPAQPAVSGLQADYCSNMGVQKGKITNLPPAGGGTTAAVKLDNASLPIAADSTFAFKVDTLAAGQHQVTVTFTNVTGSKIYTVGFTVTAAVTPDADLTANITNVVNLTNPVILMAVNVAGGGTTPLYTFARDKAITNILQSEGTTATLSIDSFTLVIGDNKIYVRMRTSATCYTTQTNVDSILLRRDAATGIVDVDNHGQLITVFPNPFDNRITISGLNSGKAYRIVLYNVRGQAVYTSEVKNKRLLDIPASGILPGVYWLTIYDTKRKPLGTEKVIKY